MDASLVTMLTWMVTLNVAIICVTYYAARKHQNDTAVLITKLSTISTTQEEEEEPY